MSAFGTKRKSEANGLMSAIGGKADIGWEVARSEATGAAKATLPHASTGQFVNATALIPFLFCAEHNHLMRLD
jgi:hypothetical protein